MDNNLMGFYTKKQYEGFKDKLLDYIKDNKGKSEAEIGRSARENANRIGVPRALIKPIIEELKKEEEERGNSLFVVKIENDNTESVKKESAEDRKSRLREQFAENLKVYDEEMSKRNTNSQLVSDLNKRRSMRGERGN